jgi:hypothetical protein
MENNIFQINNIGIIIATSETLPTPEREAQHLQPVQCHVLYPCAPDKVRDTMTLTPMRRAVQGQRHSKIPLSLPMTTRGGAAHAFSLGIDVFTREMAVR